MRVLAALVLIIAAVLIGMVARGEFAPSTQRPARGSAVPSATVAITIAATAKPLVVTVTLTERRAEHGVETEVKLLHSGFPSVEASEAHARGWSSALNKLIDLTDARGSAATLTLIGIPQSSYVCSVRMAMAEKGLAYTYDPAALHSENVTAINPFGRVPAFRDGDFELFETSAIIRYLDESFGGPSLIAGTIEKRAKM